MIAQADPKTLVCMHFIVLHRASSWQSFLDPCSATMIRGLARMDGDDRLKKLEPPGGTVPVL